MVIIFASLKFSGDEEGEGLLAYHGQHTRDPEELTALSEVVLACLSIEIWTVIMLRNRNMSFLVSNWLHL